jgi:hypothetical protein
MESVGLFSGLCFSLRIVTCRKDEEFRRVASWNANPDDSSREKPFLPGPGIV